MLPPLSICPEVRSAPSPRVSPAAPTRLSHGSTPPLTGCPFSLKRHPGVNGAGTPPLLVVLAPPGPGRPEGSPEGSPWGSLGGGRSAQTVGPVDVEIVDEPALLPHGLDE